MGRILPVLIIALFCTAPAFCKSEEWPNWLGPDHTGISTDPIADRWPAGGPAKVWEQKVGLGYSSPIGYQGKIYLLSQDGDKDILTAFDAENGRIVWNQSYRVTTRADQGQAQNPNNGLPLPLATSAIDGGHIYTYGGGGDLVCRKLEDGSPVWGINVLGETRAKILGWNQSSSPLLWGKLVFVQGGRDGSTAVAVDKETGKIVWKAQARTVGGYAAPIIADVPGGPQLIIFGGDTLYGMDPQTGRTIWSVPWRTRFEVNAATPVYGDGHLFVSSDYGQGCLMLSLSQGRAKVDWQGKQIQQKFQPAVLDRGFLYANSAGTVMCMRWPDGRIAWQARERNMHLGEGGSIVRDGDKLIMLSERGRLSLVQAAPAGYRLISQVQLFDFGTTWSTPLIYHGKLYAMGKDNLVCLDIASRTALGARENSMRLAQNR